MTQINVFEHIPASAACIDRTGSIIAVNNRWREYAHQGHASNELMAGIGFNYLEICDHAAGEYAEFAAAAAIGIRDVINGKIDLFEMEYPCHTPHEHEWSILLACPLSDTPPEHFLIQHVPITSTKVREEHSRQQQKLSSLGLMAGGIAHDINNLLQVVSAQISICEYKLEPDAPIRSNIQKAMQGIDRTASLARQMLAYSGHSKAVLSPLSINDVIAENIGLLQSFAESANVQLSAELGAGPLAVLGEKETLLQLILNLVTNAVDATANQTDGQVTLKTASVTLEESEDFIDAYSRRPIPSGSYIQLTVKDNNGGIEPIVADSIFDPFFSTKSGPRGLGLSIVIGVVNTHNGAIQLYTEKDEGTEFHIYIPASDSNKAIETSLVHEKPVEIEEKMLVLVVDDDSLFVHAICDLLATMQIESVPLTSGRDIEKKVQELSDLPTVALLDLHIKGEDTHELFVKLRKVIPNIPVILTSGYHKTKAAEKLTETESRVVFLQKPYGMETLIESIREVNQ